MTDNAPAARPSLRKSLWLIERWLLLAAAIASLVVAAQNVAVANVFAQAYPGLNTGTHVGVLVSTGFGSFVTNFLFLAFFLNILALMGFFLYGFFAGKLAPKSDEHARDNAKLKHSIWKAEQCLLALAAIVAVIAALYNVFSGNIAAGLFGQSGPAVTVAVVLIGVVTFFSWTFVMFFILNIATAIGLVMYALFSGMMSRQPAATPATTTASEPDLR